jgi:hypothetical protein
MENSLILSRQEIDGIYETCGSKAPSDYSERRTSDRWPYQEIQLLGPYGYWGLPKKHMFCEVRCHDLSQGGVSFFLPRPPVFEFAVIGLGKRPNISYLLIRVTHCREYYVDVKKLYLVGCRFLERVALEM